jgi:hypothetical protein
MEISTLIYKVHLLRIAHFSNTKMKKIWVSESEQSFGLLNMSQYFCNKKKPVC